MTLHVPTPSELPEPAIATVLRRGLLAVVLLGCAGLSIELVLQEHVDGWRQWIPLAMLALGFVEVAALALRPSAGLLRLFSLTMAAFIISGGLGVWFHYAGNVEFELERTPELRGLALVMASLAGATPSLAPGAMAQLGLTGLLYTFRHPLLRNMK